MEGWEVFYFINNLHIYDNQFEQAEELLRRTPSEVEPRLVLNVLTVPISLIFGQKILNWWITIS